MGVTRNFVKEVVVRVVTRCCTATLSEVPGFGVHRFEFRDVQALDCGTPS